MVLRLFLILIIFKYDIFCKKLLVFIFSQQTWYDNFVDTMKSIFDFSLFLDMKFALFNLSTLFLFIW